jgi:hypothetical protein
LMLIDAHRYFGFLLGERIGDLPPIVPGMETHTVREHLPEPVRVGPSMVGVECRNLGRWKRWMGP